MKMKKRIVLIGSGNVATHLALGLRNKCHITQVYSRTMAHAERLSRMIEGSVAVDDLSHIDLNADIYIICVPDDAIGSIVASVPDNGALWLHTSGTTSLDVLSKHRENCGVLYPMQSFSRELAVDWNDVHIFVEGSNDKTLEIVKNLAGILTSNVIPCDSDKRRVLHVAAVFSCNFTNHMWCQASDLLAEHGLSFDAMLPLIRNTVEKLNNLTPEQSQTGPAQRGDHDVISRHLSMLDGRRHEIYKLLSESIMEMAGINHEQNI